MRSVKQACPRRSRQRVYRERCQVLMTKRLSAAPAAIAQPSPELLALSGSWTALGIGAIEPHLDALSAPATAEMVVDGANIVALDTAGAWVLLKLTRRLGNAGPAVTVRDLRPEFARLLAVVAHHVAGQADNPPPAVSPPPTALERVGRNSAAAAEQAVAMLGFVGETAVAFARCVAHPSRVRWRVILYNIRSAGFNALPIVGLLSFLLGIVVAYQGADQLRQYGANIFVADLVGLSMLREFAPLITAIISPDARAPPTPRRSARWP